MNAIKWSRGAMLLRFSGKYKAKHIGTANGFGENTTQIAKDMLSISQQNAHGNARAF